MDPGEIEPGRGAKHALLIPVVNLEVAPFIRLHIIAVLGGKTPAGRLVGLPRQQWHLIHTVDHAIGELPDRVYLFPV